MQNTVWSLSFWRNGTFLLFCFLVFFFKDLLKFISFCLQIRGKAWGSHIFDTLWTDTEYCKHNLSSLNLRGEEFRSGMSAKASSSQLSVSSSGSGGLSHVYIQHPPLRCDVPGSRGLFYDDGNKLLLSPTSDQVFQMLKSATQSSFALSWYSKGSWVICFEIDFFIII